MRRLGLFALILIISGCASNRDIRSPTAASVSPRPAPINHIVFFNLKNPADADELIADCDRLLATAPGVVSYFAGKRLDTGRANVETDFEVGFYIGFQTQADYAAFVNHPDHVAAVKKWKPRCEWIRIHDVVDDTP